MPGIGISMEQSLRIGISMEQSPRIGIGLEQSTKQYRLFGIGIGRTLLELVNKFVWYSGCGV